MLFAFPSRYWFTIGRQRVFSLGEWSPQLPTGLHVSGGTQDSASSPIRFRLRGSHPLWPRFPAGSPSGRIGNSTVRDPTTPVSPEGDTGLGYSDFARHYFRNRGFFLFLLVLRWFTSQGLLVRDYGFITPYAGFTSVGFPIRTSPGQSLLAAHRGLSQLATSFIACFCQGIHHAPLVT